MVDGREAAEAGFDFAVRGRDGDVEVGVVGGEPAGLVVCFVDGVEEIGGQDEEADSSAVAGVLGGSGSGFGVAGADGDAVVDCLEEGGYDLRIWLILFFLFFLYFLLLFSSFPIFPLYIFLKKKIKKIETKKIRHVTRTSGRNDHPIKDIKAPMVADEAFCDSCRNKVGRWQ